MSTLVLQNDALFSTDLVETAAENLSDRLILAMRTVGVNQSELARKIGVKPQTIQYLCTSNASRSKFSSDIADALGISASWLITGQGGMMLENANPLVKASNVSILRWSDILLWLQGNYNTATIVDHIATSIPVSEKSFGLEMLDSSMIPRFEIGSILIIDPEYTAEDGDFVLAVTQFSAEPILRKLTKNNEGSFLMPLNTALYKEVKLQADDKIIGVLRQSFFNFSRG